MPPVGKAVGLGVMLVALTLVSGCGGDDASGGQPVPVTDASAGADPAVLDPCSQINLTTVVPAQLTVATTDRRVAPYLAQDERDEWVGTEAVLVYAVAQELGFPPVQVTWLDQPVTVADFVRDGTADFLIGQVTQSEAVAAGAVASTSYASNAEGIESVLAFVPANPLVTCVNSALTQMSPSGQVTES